PITGGCVPGDFAFKGVCAGTSGVDPAAAGGTTDGPDVARRLRGDARGPRAVKVGGQPMVRGAQRRDRVSAPSPGFADGPATGGLNDKTPGPDGFAGASSNGGTA